MAEWEDAVSGCCNEAGCRRKKPIILSRGGLTGAWYVVTDYSEDDEGRITAKTKHELNERQSRELTMAFDALSSVVNRQEDNVTP